MPAATLQDLRKALREKFPRAHGLAAPESADPVAGNPFEIAAFPVGAISELAPAPGADGLALWLAGLLAEPGASGPLPEFALIDGGDRFDPASHAADACSRLLWVRCRHAREALKAADLLVKDGNIPFILLDLGGLATAELRTIPASAWWRLKLGCEAASCRLVVIAAAPLIPCASRRLTLSCRLSLEDFDRPRQEVLRDLAATPALLRHTR